MFSQWAQKRVFKFLLKRLFGRIIRGDHLDSEHFEVQLGSGTIQLRDLILNTDYLNEQLVDAAVTIKEGSVGSLTLNLPWKASTLEHCEIEVHELELIFAPLTAVCKAGSKAHSRPPENSTSQEAQGNRLGSDLTASGSVEPCTYMGVHDGVRMIAKMVEKVLLGLRVRIRKILIAFEGLSAEKIKDSTHSSNSVSHPMLVMRLDQVEYGLESSSVCQESISQGENFVSELPMLVKVIKFSDVTAEVLDIFTENSGCSSKFCGQPVPIVLGDGGLVSGCIELSMPLKMNRTAISKLNAEITISCLKVRVSGYVIERLLSLFHSLENSRRSCDRSYVKGEDNKMNSQGKLAVFANIDKEQPIPVRGVSSHMLSHSYQGNLVNPVLPVTRFISDWMTFSGNDIQKDEGLAEADLEASVNEFFECLDESWSSQLSTAGSGLWTRTDLLNFANECTSDYVPEVPGIESDCGGDMEENGHEDYLDACLSEIGISLQVADCHWQSKLTVQRIKIIGVLPEATEETCFSQAGSALHMQKISCINGSLQGLIENTLPLFPVSLCPSRETYSSKNDNVDESLGCYEDYETFSLEGNACNRKGFLGSYRKRTLLSLKNVGSDPAFQMALKWELSSHASDAEIVNCYTQIHVELHLQPTILWLDPRVLYKLVKVLGRCSSSLYRDPSLRKEDNAIGDIIRPKKTVQIKLSNPCMRILVCFPLEEKKNLLKDNFLSMDFHGLSSMINITFPSVSHKLQSDFKSEIKRPVGDCINIAFSHGSLYLISSSGSLEQMGFNAHKVLEISSAAYGSASVDIKWTVESKGGMWIAKCLWDGISMQQRRGDGANGVGERNSEFAAVTYAQEVEERNKCIREDVIACSSNIIHVIFPHLMLNLSVSQHLLVISLIDLFLNALFIEKNREGPNHETKVQDSDNSKPQMEVNGFKKAQTSILVEANSVEILLHPRHHQTEGIAQLVGKGKSSWNRFRFDMQKFRLLSVSKLGLIDSASYVWLSHEDVHVSGSLNEACGRELLLLSCRNDALGRGDGGGGNALATGSAGIEVVYIAWPDKNDVADALIAATVRGVTFVAHGGRLDWLPGIVSFLSEPLDGKASQQFLLEHSCFQAHETRFFSIQATDVGKCQKSDVIRSFFSLDLLDTALCYEPGYEATMVANVRAKNFARTLAGATQKSASLEPFSPVACVLAASAVRVSSNVTDTKSQEYNIWLRDLAISVVDTTLRTSSNLGYTSEALRQAGYVKLGGVAMMEAIMRINNKEGLQWEIEFANNYLRLETCHDTTAALGRIVAQLQQLFTPEIEPSAIRMQTRKGQEKSDDEPGLSGYHEMSKDNMSRLVNSDNVGIFASVLEDAFTLMRNNNSKADTDSSLHDLSKHSCQLQSASSDSLGRLEDLNDGHEMQQLSAGIHDMQQPTACSTCSKAPLQPIIYHDFQMPLTHDTRQPSFIEDYYINCKQSGKLTAEVPLTKAQEKVEGKGGWYENGFPRVLENHIPSVNDYSADQKGKSIAILKNNSNLATKYPQSIGRVVFQDLNLCWRLYDGSDWNNKRTLESTDSMYREGRHLGVCLEVVLSGVDLQHDLFPETGLYASRLAVCIRDVHVYDCSKNAPWKKILGYHRLKSQPRESSAKAVKVELEAVRPNPFALFEEYRLSLDFSPIRLHLDQRHVDFLVDFFRSDSPTSIQQGHDNDDDRLSGNNAASEGLSSLTSEADEEALLPFFQVCDIHPFTIRVDYVPRRVDLAALRQGNYVELLNLVSWKGIELHLKHVHAAGVHGWATLSGIVVGEWLEDISQNQVHKLMKGLGPIRSLIAVGTGAVKLIVLPTQHYRKDQYLLRGMRKGAIAFLRSISLEAIGLGLHLAAGAHEILLHAESVLSGITPSMSFALERQGMSSQAIQPGDTCEGLQQACESLTHGLERTATSLIGNPVKIYQRGAGASFAVASAIRATPAAALAPASAAAGAVHRALLGIRNGLDPERKRESEEKHHGYIPDV